MAEELKDLGPLIDKCVLCGGCHPECPTYSLSRYERDAARGKVVLAGALLRGELSPDLKLAKTFDHCLACMACVEGCPAGADPVRVIMAARNEVRKAVGRPLVERVVFRSLLQNRFTMPVLAALMKIAASATKHFPWLPGVSAITQEGRVKELPSFSMRSLKKDFPEIVPAKGIPSLRVGYFTGCMTEWAFKKSGVAVIETLSSFGAEVVLLRDEVCCGAPAWHAGDAESAERMARKNIASFMRHRLDRIVTSCATCGSMLKAVYPRLAREEGTEIFSAMVVDFQALLAELLSAVIPTSGSGEEPLTVTYHDPCHLSRGMRVTREPREVLKRLPGVRFVEMDDANACCGGGGMFSAQYYGDSLEIGKKKGANIRKSDARVVVTECPSCQMQLKDIVSRYCPGVEVMHTAELAAKMLGGLSGGPPGGAERPTQNDLT